VITLSKHNGFDTQTARWRIIVALIICKIFTPNFNIVSAFAMKIPGIGRIFVRISEVYNTLVY